MEQNNASPVQVEPPPKEVPLTQPPIDASNPKDEKTSNLNEQQTSITNENKPIEEVKNDSTPVLAELSRIVENATNNSNNSNNEMSKNLAIRAKGGLFYFDFGTQFLIDSSVLLKNCILALFTKDGKYLIGADTEGLSFYETVSSDHKASIKIPGIQMAAMSIGGKFLQVWNRPDKESHNIHLIEISTFSIVKTFVMQRFKKEYWPLVRFSHDDVKAYKIAPIGVEILTVPQFTKADEIHCDFVEVLSICPSKTRTIVACGTVQNLNDKNVVPKVVFYVISPKKVTFSTVIEKAHEVSFIWAPDGENCLVWCQTLHDETGRSYYGEHILYLFNAEKCAFTPVPKAEGPVHDVAWNNSSQYFALLSGFMPAKAVVMDKTCTVKYDFGSLYVNTIRWSPVSRFLLLGGFGNLSGNIHVWDMVDFQKVGECKALSAITCQWAPDGRKFFTAIVNPRLRVDNEYRVFKYNGSLLLNMSLKHTELYEVLWEPGEFQDRPASPMKQGQSWEAVNKGKANNNGKPKKILKLRNEDFVKPDHRKGSEEITLKSYDEEEKDNVRNYSNAELNNGGGNEGGLKTSEQKKKTWKRKYSTTTQPTSFEPSQYQANNKNNNSQNPEIRKVYQVVAEGTQQHNKQPTIP